MQVNHSPPNPELYERTKAAARELDPSRQTTPRRAQQRIYPWGDELTPGGEHRCNIRQGGFPAHDTAEDGYAGTAPVSAGR